MNRSSLPFLVLAAAALALGACGSDEAAAPAPKAAAEAAPASTDAASAPTAATAAIAAEPGDVSAAHTPDEERAALTATLRDFPEDPRVKFDREVMTAFRKLRSEQRVCAMVATEEGRNTCNAKARQVYDAAKADAIRHRDDALAAAPPQG